MCGIVGFTGSQAAAPLLLDGLRKLEYRGYDSAGIAVQKGPFVYCAESVDNAFPLTQYRVSAADVRSAAPVTGLKDGFSGLSVPAVVQTPSEDTASLYRFDEQTTERPTALNMIPYYLWANRGARDMMVFLHTKS